MSGAPRGCDLDRTPGMQRHVYCPRVASTCSVPLRYHRVICPQEVCHVWCPKGNDLVSSPKEAPPCVLPQGGASTASRRRDHECCPPGCCGFHAPPSKPRLDCHSQVSVECTDSRSPWTRPQHSAMGRIQGRLCGLHGTSPGSGRGSLLSFLFTGHFFSGSMPFTQ